jgi:hypothetical protein
MRSIGLYQGGGANKLEFFAFQENEFIDEPKTSAIRRSPFVACH